MGVHSLIHSPNYTVLNNFFHMLAMYLLVPLKDWPVPFNCLLFLLNWWGSPQVDSSTLYEVDIIFCSPCCNHTCHLVIIVYKMTRKWGEEM